MNISVSLGRTLKWILAFALLVVWGMGLSVQASEWSEEWELSSSNPAQPTVEERLKELEGKVADLESEMSKKTESCRIDFRYAGTRTTRCPFDSVATSVEKGFGSSGRLRLECYRLAVICK